MMNALATLRKSHCLWQSGVKHRAVCCFHMVRKYTSGSAPNIDGVYPPITTPFDKNGEIAYDKLKENLHAWNEIPLAGYVVQGSNGEYPFLSSKERVELVGQVKQNMTKDKLLLAGSGCESTHATIALSNQMVDSGADALMVVSPSFYKTQMLDHATLLRHFTEVADKCKAPVILYNVPATTGIIIPVRTVVELASHPNIIGLKESGGDITRIATIIHQTRNDHFKVLAGSAGFLLASCAVGAVGGICALANVLGNEVCDLHRLCSEQKWSEAKALQHRLLAPNTAVTAGYGVPGLKAAMEWFGLYGGMPRLPLLPLDDEEKAKVKSTFTANGFL